MSYIGRDIRTGAFRQLDDISSGFDGSDTTHTMQVNSTNVSVGDVNQILLSLGGVIQKPGTDFTVSGSTLTFTTAPAANTSFFAILLGSDNGGTVTPTDASVTPGKLSFTDGATIKFGTDSEVELTHNADKGLILKHTATGDDKPVSLTLQTGETDIAADDVIGKIEFQAPDEGTGTDAILTAAAIQARSEGDFSSSSNATELQFMTGASEAATTKMTLSSNGLLGIGTEAPQRFLHIVGTDGSTSLSEGNSRTVLFLENNGATYVNIASANNNNGAIFFSDGDANNVGGITYKHASNDMEFTVNAKDYMKITDDGFFKFSKNETFLSTAQFHEFLNTEGDQQILYCRNSDSSSPYGIEINFSGAAPDNNTNWFLNCSDTGTSRFRIESDGDAQNHDNAYGSISDERIKSNITDANSQWDDIKAIKVRNFERKDDINKYGVGKKIQIGVVAQEVESVSPGLVKEGEPTSDEIKVSSEFGTVYEDGDTLPENKRIGDVKTTTGEKVKRVNYSVLYMKAIKALQEAMAKIETLETKVAALEGN